ncbi:hypothetical protein UlMin_035730 [Ulmus minor]
MASASMVMPVAKLNQPSFQAFSKPLPLRQSKKDVGVKAKSSVGVQVQASFKEKLVTGLTAAALTATMVIPEVAEAAGSDLTPSLQNFLLSIAAGGIVLGAIVGAVIGVSNFDPVKRT